MSVRPESAFGQSPALGGIEGELVSATVAVEPELLEKLLDALAEVRFPINPQIYHNASVAFLYADSHEEAEPTTLVEFPAYRNQLAEVRELLSRRGFALEELWSKNQLDEIHSDSYAEAAPMGASYVRVIRRKHAPRAF